MKRTSPRDPIAPATPETLMRAPHLAVLDVIDTALDTASWALFADYPGLMGAPHPWKPEPADEIAARRLLREIDAFDRALGRYRRALAPLLEPEPAATASDDDIPF